MPYLDMGEFYSEYGNYTVKLTVPAEYVVGATGVLQSEDELKAYKEIGAKNVAGKNGKPVLYVPKDKAAPKTLVYKADTVLDFAWFAEKEFVIQYDTVQLASGKVVDAFTYYHNKKNTTWKNSIDYVKSGVHAYSDWIGEYAYPVVQAVEGPANNTSGGMEYPTITLITSPDAKPETLDAVIAHEVGHNWFMGMLGSNERIHPWMDEGMNSYFQFRYEAIKYRMNSVMGDALPATLKSLPLAQFENVIYRTLLHVPMQAPIETASDKFTSSDEYGITAYVKTALWMYIVDQSIENDAFDRAIRNYFNKWKFKHPQPADMKAAFEEAAGMKMDELFALLNKEGALQ